MTVILLFAAGCALAAIEAAQKANLAKLYPSPPVKSPAQRRAMREDCRRKGL